LSFKFEDAEREVSGMCRQTCTQRYSYANSRRVSNVTHRICLSSMPCGGVSGTCRQKSTHRSTMQIPDVLVMSRTVSVGQDRGCRVGGTASSEGLYTTPMQSSCWPFASRQTRTTPPLLLQRSLRCHWLKWAELCKASPIAHGLHTRRVAHSFTAMHDMMCVACTG
jgi:hypothetical protein